jgi:uncharacterized membrane protein YccC
MTPVDLQLVARLRERMAIVRAHRARPFDMANHADAPSFRDGQIDGLEQALDAVIKDAPEADGVTCALALLEHAVEGVKVNLEDCSPEELARAVRLLLDLGEVLGQEFESLKIAGRQ